MKKISITVILLLLMMSIPLKNFSQSKSIKLPLADRKAGLPLHRVVDLRRSTREFKPLSLSLTEVSQVLWAAGGKNQWDKLTIPSAGALYPLTIYLLAVKVEGLVNGLYRYDVASHSLNLIAEGNFSESLSGTSFNQSCLRDAPAIIIISADYNITLSRYAERGKRYVNIEVGHCGQNIYLQATSLGLGTVAVGAFDDKKVKEVLGIKEEPLYIMPLGKSK